MKKFILFIPIVLLMASCSVYMAATQPGKKAIELFRPGTPRVLLLAEFGAPAVSENNKEGFKREVYIFEQGYSTGSKTARAVGHGVADLLTWGLWEAVGTPTEAVFDGNEMAYDVVYDEEENVKTAFLLKKK